MQALDGQGFRPPLFVGRQSFTSTETGQWSDG